MRTLLKIVAHGCVVAWTLSSRFLFQAAFRRLTPSQTLRLSFESLGTNWVKLGQSLALRFDVLPAHLCRELLRIRNNIKPIGYSEIQSIIERDLGRTPEDLFQSFETTPFAITSSGQLHKAVTPVGQRLVVKVQAAHIAREFGVQSVVMRAFAKVFDFIAAFETSDFSKIVEEFLEQRASELSFSATASNARAMATLAEEDSSEQNIEILNKYTGQRVLAWEFIDGVSVASLVGSARAARSMQNGAPSQRPSDCNKVAGKIYRSLLNQIFRDGIFHTDISAAGLLVLPTGAVAYVDFAVVGRLDSARQKLLQRYYESLMQGKIEEAADLLIECADMRSAVDNSELRRSLSIVLEDRLSGFESPVETLPRDISQNAYVNLLSTFRDHGVGLPNDISLYLRAMLTAESLLFQLCPEFDPVTEQSRFFSLAANQDFWQSFEIPQVVEHAATLYRDAVELVSDLRRLHYSAQAIAVSLRTLRIRLLQYGFWAFLAAACAYFSFKDESFLQTTTFKPILLAGAFLIIGIFFINRISKQGRQLSRVDSAIIDTREVSSRSLGRVR